MKIKILFLCTGNSCRSQMAEGWAHELKSDVIEAYSAGIETHGLNPNAVKVMKEAGVDILSHKSECVDDLLGIDFDYVITVCDNAHETCPIFPCKAKVIHVGFDDPPALARELAARGASEDRQLECYRIVRDEIREFVECLPENLDGIEKGGAKLSEQAGNQRLSQVGRSSPSEPGNRKAVVGESTTPSTTTQARSESFAPPLGIPWIVGNIETPVGKITVVAAKLSFRDKFGAAKVRCGIGRNSYIVEAGVYAVGNPTDESPVFVSANYKLSFDCLRSSLDGIDGWILVLDTKGINVWCAAGKGTFGTDEIVNRVLETNLFKIVSHQNLIVPQLGAPGVSAMEVRKQCGFSVIYSPVRACDIPKFIKDDYKATPEMREVQFKLRDRVVVIPVELVIWFKQTLAVAVVLAILSGISQGGYTLTNMPRMFGLVLAGWLTGGALVPALLPWLPGRAFAIKGVWGALLLWCSLLATGLLGSTVMEHCGWLLLLSAVVSFMSLNFTGTSTYTSMSGVKKEMKIAIPIQIVAIITGTVFIVWGNF